MSVELIKEINDQVDAAVDLELLNIESRINSAQSEITSRLQQDEKYKQLSIMSLSQKSDAKAWLKKNRIKKIIGYCLIAVSLVSLMSGGTGGIILGALFGIYGVIFGLRDIIYPNIKADKYSAENQILDSDVRKRKADRSIEESKNIIRECETVITDCRNELNKGREFYRHKQIVQTLDENHGAQLQEIIENAKQALITYQVDDAVYSYQFLSYVYSDNEQYKYLEQVSMNISEIVSRTTLQIPLKEHENEGGVIDRYIDLFWKSVLSGSFQYFELTVIIQPFVHLCDNSYIAIDFLAGLIYIDTKYGRKAVEKLCPGYLTYLSSFLDKANTEKLNNMASFSAWCGNPNLEKQFSAASTQQ